MASIFNSLNIGYTGLNAAQIGIDTTGHNISNAETQGYSRQRVITSAATPITTYPGQVGNGTEVQDVKRIFDNFVFDRYSSISADSEYAEYSEKTLTQLSSYFPEIDGVGVKADLAKYYDMWQSFADNPNSGAIQVALAQQTETLADHISQTQSQMKSLQSQINEELAVNINEVNEIAQQIASVNISIDIAESAGGYTANDLRDKRNLLEVSLSKLIGADVNSAQLSSNMQIDSSSNTKTGSYSIDVNGFNIVDGNTFHPIHISKEGNPSGFYEISYERQDGVLIPMEEEINGGKIGAILDLRGGQLDTTSGMPVDGIIQNSITEFDAFAKTLIESTNNLYAASATTKMSSNIIDTNPTNALLSSSLNIKEGAFDVVVYDIDGNITARRTINIDVATTMTGVVNSNSIEGQMKATVDDNGDSNANNDVDDFVKFNWATFASGDNAVEFTLDPMAQSQGYTFAIEDKLQDASFDSGSNFAGALGMSKFFSGDSASNIELKSEFSRNPTLISAGSGPVKGDNIVALNMLQHQYEKFDFQVGNSAYNNTTYGMFDMIVTEVGTQTNSAISKNETISTQFNAAEMEYFSVSKVSIDEEMTNLIKYQTSYGAAAKVITTIDAMMQTLLGIKQ